MACFIVPAAEAVIMTIVSHAVKNKEIKTEQSAPDSASKASKVPFSRKLGWLTKMLWGGSALLAFEHIWHGEVVPWFPFLTAVGDPADTADMLHEMATAGVLMAVFVTVVWLGMVAVSSAIEKRAENAGELKG
ncbi:MAG: hypothetical protein IKD89_07380 [Clostridia bacterium]|nr:hypothetical protein [Clostridia bacterium]